MSDNAVAKAYVQVVPTTQGFKNALEQSLGNSADESGKGYGSKMVSSLKKIIVASGVGTALKMAITEGGKLEQSLGGAKAIYGKYSNELIKNANNAYKTAQISANQYLELSTSYGARLLQGLNGDTKKATAYTDMAIRDMSDNANRFGTSMESIQNAYNGFAKNNFTMLDNLKIGYGGTKAEMIRLINDSKVLGDTTKVTMQNFDQVVTFDKMIEAVHKVQTELNVTGTSADEAASTLEGSFNAMKASATNLIGHLAIGESIKGDIEALATTVPNYLRNLFTMIGNIVMTSATTIPPLITKAINSIDFGGIANNLSKAVPKLLSQALPVLVKFSAEIRKNSGKLVDGALAMLQGLAKGLADSLPVLISNIPTIVSNIAGVINDNAPKLLVSGFNILVTLGKGLIQAIPTLIANIPQILRAIYDSIMAFNWVSIGSSIINFLKDGVKTASSNLLAFFKELPIKIFNYIRGIPSNFSSVGKSMLSNMWNAVKALPSKFVGLGSKIISTLKSSLSPSKVTSIGKNLIKGLWNGIGSMASWIYSKIKGFGSGVVNQLKKFFGIHSPSRLMRDEIGKYIPSGIAVGIDANMRPLDRSLESMKDYTLSNLEDGLRFHNYDMSTPQVDNSSYFKTTIALLQSIANKDENISIQADNREIARMLRKMGVKTA